MNCKKVMVKGILVPALLSSLFLLPGGAAAGGAAVFKDVAPGGAYTPYITFLYERGVIKGYPDGTYGPLRGLTRAEAVTALSIASKMPPAQSGASVFKDVPAGHWAAGHIRAGVQSGLLRGYPDGTFRPENMVTRAELAALLVNLSGSEKSFSPSGTAGVPGDHWARGVIDTSVKKSFFLQPQEVSFNPDSPATREVFARGASLAVTSSTKLSAVSLAGQVYPVRGKAWLTRMGKETEISAATGIQPGDTIRSGDDGEARITFDDGTGLLISANTDLTIKKAMGRLSVGSDGSPVSIAEDVEVQMDKGKMVVASNWLPGKAEKTAALDHENMVASLGQAPWSAASASDTVKAGPGAVTVVTPWGTVTGSGFWASEVTPAGQLTTVLMGEALISARGKTAQVLLGQACTVGAADGIPGDPRAMTAGETGLWNENRGWVESQAANIEKVTLINTGSPQGEPQPGLYGSVGKAIDSLAKSEGTAAPAPAAGGVGAAGAPAQAQEQNRTPGISFDIDYDTIPEGYQVNIYLESMENVTYLEYTFEYNAGSLTNLGVYPDVAGLLEAFAGHNLGIEDIAIDTGWISGGSKTYRTIHTAQLDTGNPLNYSGGRARLLYLDFKKEGAGSPEVGITGIKVSYGSTTKNMPDVYLTLP